MDLFKTSRYSVELSEAAIELDKGIKFVESSKCGAINSFLGVVRGMEGGQPIDALFYEAYEPMAKRQILEIIVDALCDSPEARAYVMVRLGRVPVAQSSIYICVSSRGRYKSHDASLDILNKIKSSVVIWKKAIFSDAREQWIDAVNSEAWWLI